MVRHHLKRHKYKIVVGVPMVVLLASSLSLIRDPEQICIVPEDNRYVEVGEEVMLQVIADTNEPINVIGATITAPEDLVELTQVSRENSIIDLWSEEPIIKDNTVHFSGGIVSPSGFIGTGTALTVTAVPLAEGEAVIALDDVRMLAHDGTGKEVACGKNPITLIIRPASYPSPDINGDNRVNIFDFGLVSSRLFLAYEKNYDLNMDGKITIADIAIVISNMSTSGNLGSSLALLLH